MYIHCTGLGQQEAIEDGSISSHHSDQQQQQQQTSSIISYSCIQEEQLDRNLPSSEAHGETQTYNPLHSKSQINLLSTPHGGSTRDLRTSENRQGKSELYGIREQSSTGISNVLVDGQQEGGGLEDSEYHIDDGSEISVSGESGDEAEGGESEKKRKLEGVEVGRSRCTIDNDTTQVHDTPLEERSNSMQHSQTSLNGQNENELNSLTILLGNVQPTSPPHTNESSSIHIQETPLPTDQNASALDHDGTSPTDEDDETTGNEPKVIWTIGDPHM